MKKHETISGILFFLIGLFTLFLSLRMPLGNFRAAGTGLFPLCLGVVLMALSLPIVIRGSLKKREEGLQKVRQIEPAGYKKNVLAFLLLTCTCVLLFNFIGFGLFSFFIMVSLMWLLGVRKFIMNILFSLCVAAGSYILFVKLLKIPLPKGIIGI